MTRFLLFLFLFLHAKSSQAQKLPPFKLLRYEEDYSSLQRDTIPSFYKQLKYQPLAKNSDAFISFGGEVRYQYFAIKNEDWGAAPPDKDGYVLSRFLAHADLHPSASTRIFLQFQGSLANGKASGTSPVDEDPLEIHQAFVDWHSSSKFMTVRLGRQELSFGSQRLVSVREIPNNRQSFDAARVILQKGHGRVDFFLSRYVVARKGIFDDASGQNTLLWGAYGVFQHLPVLKNMDVYYLGLYKKDVFFDEGKGSENRHSAGARIWGAAKSWNYDIEAVAQFGTFANKAIHAWTISSNTTYQFKDFIFKPELGLKTEIISGDPVKGDDQLQTFNPLFPKGAYFGLAALIGPSNLFDVHPSLKFELLKEKISLTTDYDAFWRYSLRDGIYAPNMLLIYPGQTSSERFIGDQYTAEIDYTPNRFLLLRLEATLFRAGAYLKSVGPGEDILYFGSTIQVRF
jgi:hypothetical protein